MSGIDWDFPALEEFIQDRGDRVTLELGIPCTCQNGSPYGFLVQNNGSPASTKKYNCTTCQGDGFLYRNAREITGLLTSVNAGPNRRLIESGYAVPGDCVFSPSFDVGEISDFDRITLHNSTPVSEGQVIIRNIANFKENRQLKFNVESDCDQLWYLADKAYHCEDEHGVVYIQNADFVFEGKKIKWIGNRPKDKTVYSIKYSAFLEWIAYASPFNRFDRNRTLAQKVLLRKKHVFIAQGSTADTVEKRKEEEIVFTTKTTV